MVVRRITVKEAVDFQVLQAIAFVFPIDLQATIKKAEETPEKLRTEYSWAAFTDEGTLVSGMVNWPFSIYYDGHVVGMGGIGGVVSAPEARRQGGIRAIFREVFADDRKNGRLFSVLFPFSHAYYRKFGYELCHEGRQVQFPMDALKKFPCTAMARLYKPEEGVEPLRRVYDRFASRYNYAMARDALSWERATHWDPLRAEAYPYVLSRDGQDIAYCAFKPHRESEHAFTMILTDYAYVDADALREMLGFLYRLGAQFGRVRMELPDDLEISSLLDEAHQVQALTPMRSMARVVDVERALRLMRHPREAGEYALRVEDDFLPENTATYRVRFGAGETKVSRTEDVPDMTVSVQAFAQLCLGYVPLEAAAYRTDVRVERNQETLAHVFVRKPGVLFDRF